MRVKFIVAEDFLNYKKPSMFIGTSFCTFKCEKECPDCHCQNSSLANAKIAEISDETIIKNYLANDITKAIVFGGLEPFEQFDELFKLIEELRKTTNDDIVIYTGFTEDEIKEKTLALSIFPNIIIKYGRYKIGKKHFDELLGVELVSENQYAKKLS